MKELSLGAEANWELRFGIIVDRASVEAGRSVYSEYIKQR
jgi:hypothetical protein